MTYLQERLNRRQLLPILLTAIFIINLWAIFNLLRLVPAWRLRLDAWEMVSAVGYILGFALIESLFLTLIPALLSLLVPDKLLKGKLAAQGALLVVILCLVAAGYHFGGINIVAWRVRQYLFAGAGILFAVAAGFFVVARFKKVEEIVLTVVERVSVLSWLYLVLDVLGLIIVFIRNI